MTAAIEIVVVLLGAYGVWAFRRKPRILAVVRLDVAGDCTVRLEPDERDAETLLRFMLTYASKIRWLLNDEPRGARDMFHAVFTAVVDNWTKPAVHELATDTDLRYIAELISSKQAPAAAPNGEEFRVKYFEGRLGGFVVNRIPKPGLSANLPWHLVCLFQDVRDRLNASDRQWTQTALDEWHRDAPSVADDRSIRGLKQLTAVAQQSTDNAKRLRRE